MTGMDLLQIIAIVGTPFGIWLGQQMGTKAEAKRWLREWEIIQIQERRTYAADALSALDALNLVHEIAHGAAQGTGPAMDPNRVTQATEGWRSVVSRRYMYADTNLQNALTQYDVARSHSIEAINSHDHERLEEAARGLEQAHDGVGDAAVEMTNTFQRALANHVSAAQPWWTVERWRPNPPIAPMPSILARAQREQT